MVTTLDVRIGELYSLDLPEENVPILAEFAKELRDGRLMFRREGTDYETYVDLDLFEKMRSDGRADRIRLDAEGQLIEPQDIDPLTILDPDDPNITGKERAARLRQQQRLLHARTLRFYAMRYDLDKETGRGRRGLEKFIARHRQDATDGGYTWECSPTSILRAVDECGTPGVRHLTHFFKDRQKPDREKHWPRDVVEAANRAIEFYWDDQTVTIGDAMAQFRAEADLIECEHAVPMPDAPAVPELVTAPDSPFPSRKRRKKRTGVYPIPCEETVRLWLHQNADWVHWAQRYGVKNANARFRGRGRIIDATRPLEYVMFDHTKIDAWAVVLDDDGQPIMVARAWLTLAIDCFSRMVLGAVIGFEPPSLHSVAACLRQVVSRKEFLREYGYMKGAADGWGKPFTIIVDNGKEFVSPSFQSSCEAAGIDVIWAPVGMPTYKAYVERIFGTLNTMLWHKLPGGLPLTPQQRHELGLEPQADAVYTKAQLEKAMWNTIVTRYHLETHSKIGMAPALKWKRGIHDFKRATADSTSMLGKIFGRGKNKLLSAEGVTVDGHRFHDPELTSMLMNRLAKYGKERQQRNGLGSTRTVPVRVSYNPGDVSRIHVWDPTSRTFVTLPNWDRLYAGSGLSWYAADRIKEFANQRNMAFHSDKERVAARAAHREYLLELIPGIKALEASRRARIIDPQVDLVPGDRIEMISAGSEHDLAHDTSIMRTDHNPKVKVGRPFGGKAGVAKAIDTRQRNREAAKAPPSGVVLPGLSAAPSVSRPKVDVEAIRARVSARHAAKFGTSGEST